MLFDILSHDIPCILYIYTLPGASFLGTKRIYRKCHYANPGQVQNLTTSKRAHVVGNLNPESLRNALGIFKHGEN